MSNFSLSYDQQKALHDLLDWYKKDKDQMPYVTLGGYAGTGKTTLLAYLRQKLAKSYPELKVGFASYTGKAARVLRNKLREHEAVESQDTVGTIHSLIYSPITNEQEEIIGWKPKDKLDRTLLIIDEASMVDAQIWRHLMSYKVPIIAVGDHGQLPPISGSFNLMQKPHLRLEEIHRQAKENPIIHLSIQIRETGQIDPGAYADTVRKFSRSDSMGQEMMQELLSSYQPDTLILCGYNTTRKRLNAHVRSALGFTSPMPTSGDRVICLRNNHKKRIFNGMLGTITEIEQPNADWFRAEIAMEEEEKPFFGLISAQQFETKMALNFSQERKRIMQGDLFDFGYALTVHKAQGSQARKVVLFEERFKQMDDDQWRRWLYTAVTRAEEELYVFGG
jgi:exodeoxyribonuclease-5